jgi:formate hydrogenlyase subunit 3/multisubunit Na+/H+ antiporter MnhD subunit
VIGVSDRKQGSTGSGRADRKFLDALLVVFTCLCIFGGAYVAYAFNHLLKRSLLFSTVSGVGLFAIGIALMGYLAKRKIIS